MPGATYDLADLCNALGVQTGNSLEAIRLVRALREQAVELTAVVDAVLDTPPLRSLIPADLRERVQSLRMPLPGPYASRRLGVLTHKLEVCAALILESIHITHADVLHMISTSRDKRDGLMVESAVFHHVPTGNEYSLSVVKIPKPGAAS